MPVDVARFSVVGWGLSSRVTACKLANAETKDPHFHSQIGSHIVVPDTGVNSISSDGGQKVVIIASTHPID
jgi:hypothetical protein